MITVRALYHYPVKGLSAQPLVRAAIESGKPFPQDRVYALARPGGPYDVSTAQWAKKGQFVMLMLDEGLAGVASECNAAGHITLRRDDAAILHTDLNDAAGRADLERLVWTLAPKLPAAPKLVRAKGGHFMDKPDNVISLINLATVRSLEQQWGVEIDPLRFRANIYIDGAEPWQEFDWLGGDIAIGGLDFSVDRRNGRCGATNVNPRSGARDLDIPRSLRSAFGHKDLGVYLVARGNGDLNVGDAVAAPQTAVGQSSGTAPAAAAPDAAHSYICAGCYFIYDESKGFPAQAIAAGTSFASFPETWRCPDCGTGKSTFRPNQKTADAR